MIKAINKAGMISEFSERVWNTMASNHNGFIELTEGYTPTTIPDKIMEFKAKKVEPEKPIVEMPKPNPATASFGGLLDDTPLVVQSTPNKSDANAEMEIMREALKIKGIKSTHLMGYDKLKSLYDENNK